ncbi:1-(5-phosphoribosyl)-5-[(5-phosphoribosylamino)methylideneamino]imidazole-4-carboxamide isomerase [Pelagibacteraceae bacterium]|nr:1-(5-phosphoribosyl)-5-[(5-phosphoribosylamino)methylideneamino]imidazole-4-carboxamide isomerase [Pelagibacteraceae bacterium]
MQIIPAIDLKDNKCVRLSEGKDESSVVFNNDPEKQAIIFEEMGCKKLHIVDLDAAFGRIDINLSSIKKIRNSIKIPIQLGGGIRSIKDAERYFDLGINNLILGSMSIYNPDEVRILSEKYKQKIYISLDVKDDNIMIKGWKEESKLKVNELINMYKEEAIKGYVLTDIKNDGMLKGLDIKFVKEIISKIQKDNKQEKKIIIAGGLTNYEDLTNLMKLKLKNIEGIISGKSFYVGNIDLNEAQKIIDQNA